MTKNNYIGFKAWDLGFDAHMTFIYTGKMSEDEISLTKKLLHERGEVKALAIRNKIDMFGYGRVPVVTLWVTPALKQFRRELIAKGVPNPSKYKWNPHITLKLNHDDTITIPKYIKLTDLDIY